MVFSSKSTFICCSSWPEVTFCLLTHSFHSLILWRNLRDLQLLHLLSLSSTFWGFIKRFVSTVIRNEIPAIAYPIEYDMAMWMFRIMMPGYDILGITNPHLLHPFLGNLHHKCIYFFVLSQIRDKKAHRKHIETMNPINAKSVQLNELHAFAYCLLFVYLSESFDLLKYKVYW